MGLRFGVSILFLGSSIMAQAIDLRNEITKTENTLIATIPWNKGEGENRLYFSREYTGDAIPSGFLVLNDKVIFTQSLTLFTSEMADVYTVFDRSGQTLNTVRIVDKNSGKYTLSPYNSVFSGDNKILTTIEVYEPEKSQPSKTFLAYVFPSEGYKFQKFGQDIDVHDDPILRVQPTVEGGAFAYTFSNHILAFDKTGTMISDFDWNKHHAFFADKYGHVYVRERDNLIGVYDVDKKRIASIDVPAEIGNGFTINGGDVDSFLYQTTDHVTIDNDSPHSDKSAGDPERLLIYTLEIDPKSDHWILLYRGYVTLGSIHRERKRGDPEGKVYPGENLIETGPGWIQIDPDGTIYHGEYDSRQLRIFQTKIEVPHWPKLPYTEADKLHAQATKP